MGDLPAGSMQGRQCCSGQHSECLLCLPPTSPSFYMLLFNYCAVVASYCPARVLMCLCLLLPAGNLEAAAGRTAASRRASPAVLLRYAADGYIFVGFAATQKLRPLQHTTAAAAGGVRTARRAVG
jgi:hypothetical protein